MNKLWGDFKEKLERHWHKVFIGAHVGYFGTVALEGHGAYASFGGLMAVLVVIGAVFHLGE